MDELKDIEGLAPISYLPIAWGWWCSVISLTIIVLWAFKWYKKRSAYLQSWQYQTLKRLQNLQTNLAEVVDLQANKEILDRLAIELKNIAINIASRKNCAALVGRSWIDWLESNDPNSFRWAENADLLLQQQYQPAVAQQYDKTRLQSMIKAAKVWVQAC